MAISRQQIHDLNNLLNKITIICGGMKDMLETEPLETLSVERLKERGVELIKAFSSMEQTAIDAANIAFEA